MNTFRYSNPFSSIDLRTAQEKDTWNEWEDAHYEQGFCITEGAVSFSTLTDCDYEVQIEYSDSESLPCDCLFAVRVPIRSPNKDVCIRGGYTDLDLKLNIVPQSITFIELGESRLILRIGAVPCETALLLQGNARYARECDFTLTAQKQL